MGPVAPGAQLSQNHWSIYLIIKGGGSVRLNMETDPTPGKHEGIFKVTRHQLTIIGDLVNAGYIGDTNATATLNQVIQFNYSRNQHPVALPMLKGSFY
ncbi:hypothetical protein HRR78_007883 [Exophiala dermatitidis]|nr:hypothetical protein HRR78_007883 [Exophiala dermatitidis]